ncbi:MAG TPA: cytochrome P450 [Ktedonobacterales bacterium]|nr:cytochrome P450 [Ktedonobacterales bacterium]
MSLFAQSSSSSSSPLRTAPGPTDVRATTASMQRTPLSFLLEMTRQYGDVVRLPLGSGPLYVINHPDGVRQVLQEHAANFGKDPHENDIFIRFVGHSILTTEGDTWLRLRHLEQPAFHRQQILATSASMVETIQDYLDEWQAEAEQGKVIDMVPAMTTLVLRVLGKALFSLDLEDETQIIAGALKVIGAYALALYYQPWLPAFGPLVKLNRRYAAVQRALDQVVFRMIHKRRTQLGEPNPADLLSFFLQLRDDDGKPAFTDAQIRNEALSLLIAGHENASSLLCWTWYLLAQHPSAAQRVADEVAAQLQGRTPTLADLGQLPYLRMVLEESLRLYPPAWSFPRRAHAQDTIGGYVIPAGAAVLLCPYTTHRHPAFWSDPEKFDPERFREAAEVGRPRYAHFPFGGGQHQCMGATFAMMEAHLILASIAQRYRLDLLPNFSIHPEPLVTLRPQTLPMQLQPAR